MVGEVVVMLEDSLDIPGRSQWKISSNSTTTANIRGWPTMSPWLFDARWIDCSNFLPNATKLKVSLRSRTTNVDIVTLW